MLPRLCTRSTPSLTGAYSGCSGSGGGGSDTGGGGGVDGIGGSGAGCHDGSGIGGIDIRADNGGCHGGGCVGSAGCSYFDGCRCGGASGGGSRANAAAVLCNGFQLPGYNPGAVAAARRVGPPSSCGLRTESFTAGTAGRLARPGVGTGAGVVRSVRLSDLRLVSQIGEGGFGKV